MKQGPRQRSQADESQSRTSLSRRRRDGWFWLAGSLWAASVGLTALIAVAAGLDVGPGQSGVVVGVAALTGTLGLLAFTTVGGLIAWLRPHNLVGWLLVAAGLVWIAGTAAERYVLASDGSLPGSAVAAALLDSVGWVAGLGLVAAILLLFPTGREPSPRWRIVRWVMVASGSILALSLLLTPGPLEAWPSIRNPFGVEAVGGVVEATSGVARLVFLAALNGALIAVAVRFFRSSGLERRQISWVAFAALLMALGFMVGAVLTAFGLPGEPLFNTVPMMLVPVAVGVAVLRYRVWDLDLVVGGVLTYGFVAAAITTVYVLMVGGLGGLIGAGTRGNVWLAVLATAIAAALFQPAREAAKTAARRLVFGAPRDVLGQAAVGIRTLDGFRVERYGEPVANSEWQSRKARQLVKMLVARRGRPVHREELIEMLWPDEVGGNLANRLAVAASTVRAVFDPTKAHGGNHFVKGDHDTLRLDLESVVVDVERFLDAAAVGLGTGGSDLEAAERMYRGDFLPEDIYEDWSQPLRVDARAVYLSILRARADEQSANVDAFVATQRKILDVDPWDEDAHRAIVSALIDAGRHGEAARANRRYRMQMHELGVIPADDATGS